MLEVVINVSRDSGREFLETWGPLLGVIVGALVTGLFAFGVEWYKTRGRIRAAARLVATELFETQRYLHALRAVILREQTDLDSHAMVKPQLESRAWSDHQGTLALGIRDNDFEEVAKAYLVFATEWDAYLASRYDESTIEGILAHLRRALAALKVKADLPGWYERVEKDQADWDGRAQVLSSERDERREDAGFVEDESASSDSSSTS